jgi:hypothetical protein
MAYLDCAEEELGAVGVGTSIGHAQNAWPRVRDCTSRDQDERVKR